ncbi:Amino acid adenylation [Ophiocordyceps sinensis CO18]|uniref:Amino acid adenylation n=1 Tax=Ophiocordyceps sinensis (strain Co18 / CGMCC 3.14243) TaxID=911162 RepID=T5ADH2_OPHSC|nr:Amino acid adenylation [Ophiocordyceps sinensis CO18]
MQHCALSILNPYPTKLSGPDRLHHLVTPPCHLNALEYLSRSQRTSYTYRQLHDAADAIARHISDARRRAGRDGTDFIVPVLIPQSPLLYMSLLAILKAGGAFCPLNSDAPRERFEFILKDVLADVVLVSSALASRLPDSGTGVNIIQVDQVSNDLYHGPCEHREPSPDDLAYVMYTSGSTGPPKGVAVSHAAATQALLAHDRHIPVFSRFLQFAAPTFDVSVFEIFFPLFRGATLIAARRDDMLDDLPSVLRQMDVDACELTPTVAGSLLRSRRNAPSLKLLLTIGEMLSTPVVHEFAGSQTKASMLWAMYGPTEATIHCTLQAALSSDSTTSNIGVPLDTVSCFVIEPCSPSHDRGSFKILPQGEAGELVVGGHQLARGYLNRAEQTAATFISSPYGRLYRTGDRARLNADGKLECLGRLADGQVKLRGQRIELGEIEQATLSTPGCHGAVAAVVDSNLVVFCAVDQTVTEDAIVMHCKKWLPLFMVPGEVIMLAEFPRLPSGKIDTRRLKLGYGEQKLADQDNDTSLEEDAGIIHVVSLTLGRKVNRRTNLASAGVDSLSAIRLASALRLSGFVTTASELLKLKTVSDLCFTIRNRSLSRSADLEPLNVSLRADLGQLLAQNPELRLQEEHVEDVLPCTPLQSAMLAETVRDSRLYSNEMELRAAPGLTPDDVIDAIRQVVQGNEILRTGFAQWRGGFVAILYKGLGTTETLQKVREFRHGLAFAKTTDFLRPLRFQVRADTDGTGLRLLVQAHHSVYDGWSMDVILSDLSALLCRAPLSPRPQFREVLRYHARDKRAADDLARKFWSEHLLGRSMSPFPRLTARSSAPSEIKTTRQKLKVLPDQVREVSNHTATSTQVPFQASLILLWSGITGEKDVTLGSVTSGRTIPVDRIEDVVGPCIASLPLRVNIQRMSSYAELLKSIQASNRAIMEHCALPLSDIKKLAELQPSESLYDVLFVYQESLEAKTESVRMFTKVAHMDRLETKLLFEIEPDESGYHVQVTYHSSWFPPGLIECLIEQFQGILLLLLHDPESRIQPGVESTMLRQSIHNESKQSFPGAPDLAVQFEATVAKFPRAPALCFTGSSGTATVQTASTSYQELNENANQVAHYLASCDVAVGDVLAIIMQKSPIFYTSVLGIVKAGCAYLPILPTTPEARVREILKQGRIKHCLVHGDSPTLLSDDVRFHEMESGKLVSYSKENRGIAADPSRLAYVIYTSGTMGSPKGVAVTQKNIVSNIALLHSTYPAPKSAQPRLLQACSQAFDVSVFEIFFAWHAGMCLCAAVNDDMFEDLENSIRRLEVTHLSLTPTVASLIEPANVPDVEFLVTAGESMTLSVLDRWDDRLWQGYGPSETTNICSVKRMKRGDTISHLGWALPNTSTFVMRPGSLETVPTGWVGEFCFGGDQVAMGYLNDSGLTSEKFLNHPKFGRIYRSGDVGRMLPDGSLMIIGRLDDQIKLRGQRIEAGKINSVITSASPAVAAVTMIAQRGQGASDQLVSFFVPPGAEAEFGPMEIDQEALRQLFATLSSRVPSYMVPSYLVPVSLIPVGPSGKVDRRRLQACFESLARDHLEAAAFTTQSADDETNWTTGESIIADVLAHSTKVSRADIGRWTPFAALGVDSISAIDVARKLNSRMGTLIPISAILQSPTVAQLAKYAEANDGRPTRPRSRDSSAFTATFADEVRASLGRDSEDIEDIFPCTPLQESMLSQGTRSYCNKILLRLQVGAEDMRAFWDDVSQRHGILRTCFVTTRRAAHPIAQVVLRNWKVSWRSFNVNEPSLAGATQEHLRCLPEPLDSGQPPISCALIRYKGTIFFSLICHHAVYDGVAMENLWREIEALANGRTLPPPVAYKPFIQQVIGLPEDTDAFWAEQFRDFQPSILFTRLAGADIDQCKHTTSLGVPLRDVQKSLRSLGVSLLSVCQAAWATLISMACGCSDIAFGNVINGRTVDLAGLDRLIAPCFNTIPLRVDLSRTSQNMDIVRWFQDLNARMLQYQFTSLRQVQRIAKCHSRALFDTLLLLQQPLKDMDESVWTLEEDSGDMDVPLVCEVIPCPNLDSIVVNVHYDIGIVSGDTATALADTFKRVFKRLIDLPFASPDSKSTLREMLQLGIADLVPRPVKSDGGDLQQSEIEVWSYPEKVVRQILSELSGVPEERITRHTNIFRLGLDSINAIQVASMLKRKGYELSTSDVIQYSNCAKLAPRLVGVPRDDVAPKPSVEFLHRYAVEVSAQISSAMPPDLGERAEAVLPAAPIQAAMLAAFIQSQGRNYLNMLTYRIDDDAHVDKVLRAWKVLYYRHPMLRTGFIPVNHNESPFAMVRHKSDSIQAPIEYIDGEVSRTFELQKWQDESRCLFLQCPHLPHWKVVVVDYGHQVLMSLAIHHALYDASSLGAIFGGLSRFIHDGDEPTFPSVQPALAEILARSRDEKSEAQRFWEMQADKVVVNKFPSLTPLREEDAGLATHETVSSISFKMLSEAAGKCGTSIQAAVQCAWARVLASYLGESSVVFGVTMHGRTTEATQVAPFPCITTVPVVATNVSSNRELMREMMGYNVELHKHQFSPLNQIQKWLGHSASPVFDTLLVYQRESLESVEGPWTLIKDEPMVEYAVSLEVEPTSAENLCLRITFAKNVLPEEQACLLVQQFDATLQHLICEPDDNEHGLCVKRPDLFAVTPAVSPVLPAPVQLLHEFVEHMSATKPDSTALEFATDFDSKSARRRWSYRELDLMGNRVANLLRETTKVGDIVAIHFHKCPEAYFSILGILKAGCSFVALDPHAPSARKEFILRDSCAKGLVTDVQSTLDFDVSTDILRIGEESLKQCPAQRPALDQDRLTPALTCYCLYTSGTTGTPKGCEISHENAVQAMMAFQELFRGHWEHDSRWLQFAALHFDVSVLEQYWSWSVGITVVAAPRDLILDDLTGAINRLGVTHIDLTPSLARLTHPDEMPGLCKGVFITGGEQLRQEILDKWGPKAVIYNAYGPTEATIGVTMYQRVPVNGRPSNIGKQFTNVGSYVLHPETEMPVLRGAVGELCVSGKLVGKGYLNRPELTEERFPTLAEFGERVYRTGDLVRILHDGCFEFLGRADDQVKLRGQRLEIGEINHAIRTGVPEVQNVATLLVPREASGKDVLVSFFVGKQHGGSLDLSIIRDTDGLGAKARAACLERLPTYMVPTCYLRLPYIPLSANNKVEAKELKALFEQLSPEQLMKLSAATAASQDSSLDKRALGEIIRVVSEFSKVPVDAIDSSTSIFDLGVDSITGLRLSMLLRSHGFQAASPAMLLRRPIIADMVQALTRNANTRPQGNAVREARQVMQACHHRHLALVCRELSLGPDKIEYIAPCSSLQQGLIFKALKEEGAGAYFNSFELRLNDNASLERVRRSWTRLVDLHAILRSVFVNTPDGHVQVALKQPKNPWRELMVRAEDEANDGMGTEMRSWVDGNRHHIVNPLELILVHGPGFQRVFIHIFHALYDGNSLGLMSQYASALYHDEEPLSGPPFVEALAYGPLQRHDHCRQFWMKHLHGWEPSPLSTLPKHPGEPRTVTATRNMSLGRLEDLRSLQNVTLQSVVLALWAAVLQKHLADKMTIGVVVAGRSVDVVDVERTIGPLFNTVPLFVKTTRGHTWASMIHETYTFSTSILPFQHVPLKSIQKWCSKGRSLFDNLFAFQVERPSPAGEDPPWFIEDGPSHADYPLAFEATLTLGGELRVSAVAQSHFADVAMLEDMLDRFEHEAETARGEDLVKPLSGDEDLRDSKAGTLEDGGDVEETGAQFNWTDQAVLVREEVATLAGVPAEEVTATTTLLQLGLDSIDTMKLSTRLKRRAIVMSASHILGCQSIARMVEQMELGGHDCAHSAQHSDQLQEMKRKLDAQVEKAGIDSATVESVLPPTALQEAMVAGMVQSGFQWYFNHDILEVAEWVDLERLSQAWQELVEASPILRAGFFEVDDADLDMAYCQVIFREPALRIKTVVLSDISDVSQITLEATQLALEGKALRNLLQLTFSVLGHQRFAVLSMAHALYDGWSLDLMYRDLEAAYTGHIEPRGPLDPFISRTLASRTADAHEFWASHLAGLRPTLLARKGMPTEAASVSSNRPLRREITSKKTLSEVKQFCRNKSISLQALCAASWAMVVADQVGALDVVFGAMLSGRDGEGDEDVMFPTMNTVAMRCILHGSVSGFLQYLEESMAEVRSFQAFPLRKAHAAAKLRSSDVFDSLFLLSRSAESDDISRQMLRSIGGESAVEYPVCIEAEPAGDELVWRIACHAQLFSSEETEALITKTDGMIQFMLENDSADVLSFDGEDVSICGMPAVAIEEASPDPPPASGGVEAVAAGLPDEHHCWNEKGIAIRHVLSQVSQVPVEAITPRSNLYQLGLDSISAIKVSMLLRKSGIHIKPRDLVRLPRSVFFPEFCHRVNGAVEVSQVGAAWQRLTEETPILRTVFIATGSRDLPWLQVVVNKGHAPSCRFSQPLARLSTTRDELDQGLVLRLRIHHALYDGFSLPAITSRLSELLNGGIGGEQQGFSRWARYCITPCLLEVRRRRQMFWTAYLGEGTASPETPWAESTERGSYLEAGAIDDMTQLRVTASRSGISLQSLVLAGLATCLSRRDARGSGESMILGIYLANRTAGEGDSPPATYPTLNIAPLKVQLGRNRNLMTLARAIQDDIHSMSSDGRAEVGLWEILDWTGIKVDYFVNFLADLPDERADADSHQAAVTLTPVEGPGDGSATEAQDTPLEQPWGQRNAVRDAFPSSVDVEASVRDRRLAMGVFGRVSDEWAAGLIADTAALLGQLGV